MNKSITNADILEAINDFRDEVRTNYVSKDTFDGYVKTQEPLKNIVYGAIGVILFAVMSALVALVVKVL